MGKGWNLQTNLKNKPNAQGTLFSGGTEQMNPEKRYPRGYTPERQRAVNRSMGYMPIDHTETDPRENKRTGDIIPSRKVLNVEEAIKRSTVPAADVKGVRIHIVDDRARRFALEVDADPNVRLDSNTLGLYSGKRGGRGPAEIDVRHDAGDFTLIHEIGHHASAIAQTPHSTYDVPRRRGEEEGFADHYADQHTRLPKRAAAAREQLSKFRGTEDYEPTHGQAAGFNRYAEFESGYNRMRPKETRVANPKWDTPRKPKAAPQLPGLENR